MSIVMGRGCKMSAMLDEMARDDCEALCQVAGLKQASAETPENELHYQAFTEASLIELAPQLAAAGYFLVMLVANDEQGFQDSGRFCLYHIFSHPAADLFLWISYVLPGSDETYPSM